MTRGLARSTARRPSSSRTAGVVALTLLALSALTGCGDDEVQVRPYDVSAAGRQECAALIDALPETVSGKKVRAVSGPAYAAAWGDPAIILRCGVGKPEGFDKFSACQRADGIDWFVPEEVFEDQSADVLMTTVGRSPAVDVLVPARYRPTLGPMIDLAPALKAHTTATTPCR